MDEMSFFSLYKYPILWPLCFYFLISPSSSAKWKTRRKEKRKKVSRASSKICCVLNYILPLFSHQVSLQNIETSFEIHLHCFNSFGSIKPFHSKLRFGNKNPARLHTVLLPQIKILNQ